MVGIVSSNLQADLLQAEGMLGRILPWIHLEHCLLVDGQAPVPSYS